jgi:TnpA family transposase
MAPRRHRTVKTFKPVAGLMAPVTSTQSTALSQVAPSMPTSQMCRTKVVIVNVGVRDSTYVLAGLLHHESDLRIEAHYADTAGFTDHVLGLMHLLCFRFAPCIRDLGDTKLFILDWLQNVEPRHRVHAGLTKGEARNALARTVSFHRLGEIRDRGFEQQQYWARGLNLLATTIVRWNTVYLE